MVENKLFEALFDVIPFSVYAVDVDTFEVVYANKMMRDGFYEPEKEFCWEKIFGQESACHWCSIAKLKQRDQKNSNQKLCFEFFNEASNTWNKSYDELISWPDGRLVKYSIAVDITEQKEVQGGMVKAHAELAIKSRQLTRLNQELSEAMEKLNVANRQLEIMARTDALTGLRNRRSFFEAGEERLQTLTGDARFRLYAVMLDIDHFKKVNDTYGHAAGDEVLRSFARKVSDCLDGSEIFARLGGEEFAILLVGKSEDEIAAKVELIRAEIESFPVHHEENEVRITSSFGVSRLEPGDNLDTLLDRADQALYESKQGGRNQTKFRYRS